MAKLTKKKKREIENLLDMREQLDSSIKNDQSSLTNVKERIIEFYDENEMVVYEYKGQNVRRQQNKKLSGIYLRFGNFFSRKFGLKIAGEVIVENKVIQHNVDEKRLMQLLRDKSLPKDNASRKILLRDL